MKVMKRQDMLPAGQQEGACRKGAREWTQGGHL